MVSCLHSKKPNAEELFDLDSFDLAFMLLTNNAQLSPIASSVVPVFKADASTLLWGPEQRLLATILRSSWKQHAAKLQNRIAAILNEQSITALHDMVDIFYDQSEIVGNGMWRDVAGKVSHIFDLTRDRSIAHFFRLTSKTEKAVYKPTKEKFMQQMEILVTRYPESVYRDRALSLAEQAAASKSMTKEQLDQFLARTDTFLDQPDSYFDLVSDVEVGTFWSATAIEQADMFGINTYIVITQGDDKVCPVCDALDGHEFSVPAAMGRVDDILSCDILEPGDLSDIMPFVRMGDIEGRESDDISQEGYIPPFHNKCRCDIIFSGMSADVIPELYTIPIGPDSFLDVSAMSKKDRKRVERATKHYNPATKSKQDIARRNEQRLARVLGGECTKARSPFDVWVGHHSFDDVPDHVVEVKTLIDAKTDKITMRKDSLDNKRARLKKFKMMDDPSHKVTVHTVVFDERTGKLYYKEGVGSFRLGSLTEVDNIEDLQEIILGHSLDPIVKPNISSLQYALEKHISHLDKETLVVFNKEGDIIFQKAGTKSKVEITPMEVKALKKAKIDFKGGIFTHNHPFETSLSPEDVMTLITHQGESMTAVTKDYRYTITLNQKEIAKQKLTRQAVTDRILNQSLDQWQKIVYNYYNELPPGTLSEHELNRVLFHDIWENVAQDNHDIMTYVRERVDWAASPVARAATEKEAISNMKDFAKSLTKAEMNIVKNYTSEDIVVPGETQHMIFNRLLKRDETSALANKQIKTIRSVLSKAPKVETTVWRGKGFGSKLKLDDFMSDMSEDAIVNTKGFLSTSLDKDRALEFARGNINVLYKIKSKNGVLLTKDLTNFPTEKEVLFDHNSLFRVTKVTGYDWYRGGATGSGPVTIHLEELA